jgi:hypothetical protein
LIDFLSFYGTVVSEIDQELFIDGIDPNTYIDGTNVTGTYAVQLHKKIIKIPQLAPILRKRIKINYPEIHRICIYSFCYHSKQVCHSQKSRGGNTSSISDNPIQKYL